MRWQHPQFEVSITAKYSDQAYKNICLTTNDLPGIVDVVGKDKLELSFEHRFCFSVPREYPQNLGAIKIVNKTPLFHPRIGSVGANACYTVNGEIDRILVDIIYNILLRPQTVRPPTEFKDADWGLNSKKMRWYIDYGPQKIYDYLKTEWGKRQRKSESQTKGKKVKFLE